MKRIATLLTVFALLLLSLSTMAVTVGAVDYEAELTVGTTTTNYETLNEALLAAYAAADDTTTPSVKLLKNVSMTDRLDWNKEAAFTLDLNDKILDGFDVNTGVWMENGKITVVDTAQTKTTKYYTVNDDGLWVKTNAVTERAVVGGILTSGDSGNIVDSTGGEVVMNGVSVVGGESGIRISAAASFNNVNFCGNLGTGAVEIATAETCTFTGCRFYENRYTATNITTSYSGGGAICVEYGTAPTIQVQNCDFQGNQSNEYGGAIFCPSNVRLLVQGCTFQKNHAERLGGAICIKNTGDISSPSDKCVLIDTVITDNTAGENGGGIYYEKTPEKASCFVAGSMVTMADGTTKKIEEIKVGDEVKTFDHETGCLSSAKVYLAWEDKVTPQPTFKLHFDGDLTVHCIASHTFLEKELRKYVTVSLDNAEDFIGRYFFAEDGAWHELLDVTAEKNETVLYEFYTEKHQNGFVGGMLSAPTDVAHLLNIYELDENLKADEAVLQNDIETYGLVSYEYAFETSGMSEEWFEAAGTKYLFIAIGKGLVTLEEAMGYYAETQTEDTQAPLPLMLSTPLLTSAPMLTNALLLTAAADPLPDLGDFSVGVLSLGKNVTVIDNKVGENESNVYLASGYIKLCDNHSGILAGVTLPYDTENSKEGDGQFTSNGALADRALFFHDGATYAVKFDNTNESAPFLALTAGYKVTAATCQNGKVGVLGNNNVFLPEDVVTLSATPDDGYVLNKITAKYNDGTKDCDLTVTDGKITMPAYDVTVCASFVKAYTVTYETNGGSTVANAYGTKIVFPAEDPTKDGCLFDGWYTDSTLKIKAVEGTEMTANTTLYANWISVIKTQPNKDKTNDYTVVVDDSLIGQVTYQWYEYVDGISDVALTGETSSKFAGTALSDASFYCVILKGGNAIAKTDKLTPACISFSGPKGAAGTAPETVYQLEGRSVTLPANPFTADGGAFAGWSDGETAYAANGTYTVSGNTAFTVKLEHTCHNLVFDTVLCEETMNYQNYSEWNKYYELPSGNYYLANDLTLTASITLLGKTAICLNGHVLNLNGYSINGWGYDLILVDCQVNDAHPHYYKVDEESGFWTLSDALDYDKTVTGGVITGGASDNSAISVGTLIAEDVNFIGNGTSEIEKGGAAHVITASLRRCRFFGNVAEKGGAVYADNELAVYSTEFLDNRATVDGGAVYAIGKARIENCTLKNNQATQKGGAAVFACKSSGSGAFTVLGTVISDNKAGVSGGGIAFDKAGCFAEGTKITMADGTKKNIEDVKVGDLVKTFNHETGAFESGKVSYVFEGSTPATYFTLSFESGKTLNIYDCHDLFEKTANKYVTVTAMNCQDFIGHEFYNAEDGVWETLASATPDAGEANYYSIYVYDTQNCLANGMLSVPDDVDFILNVYEFDSETLKANEQTLAADIAKYGLFTFEECKLCDSKEMFDDANLQYKNLYIGKGLITAFDLNEFYYSVHGVDEYTKGLEGFAVVLGKNVVIKNNKVGENVSNVALDKGAMIYVVDGAAGIEAGVSLSDTVGIFAKNVYTNDADKIVFTSDVAGLSQNKTASETTPVTYTYSFSYIKEQPCKNNDYTVAVEETLTGVTYQWYKYVDGENDVALTGETNAKLGTTVLAEASYYCKLSKGGAEIAESDLIAPVAVSFAGGTDATGTTPATVYQLEGRKIILPANPYTKTGYKFDKWETYAAGSDYTVGDSDVTLTAAWTEKATLTIDSTAQESEIGDSLSPYAVKCTETSTGFTVSYRKYTAEAWSTAAPNDIGVYQVRIERAEDDTYKAVDLSFVGGYGIYYLFTFSDAGATSGKAPNSIKSTVGLADFNPDTSALVSANTLAKEGFVQDGWLAEREGELVKWETRGTSTSVVFYPCWKPVVKTLDKDNDFGVTLSGTDISYQWYAYTAVAFDDIDSENYAFVYGTYDAQTKTITSTGDGGMNIIAVFLDPDFASTASYLSCKFSCDEENDYYDFDSNYLNPNASQLYRVNVVDIDGELYLYINSFVPFTASDLTLYVPKALSGETKNKTEKISGADIVCRVSYINRVGELTFVSSTLSNTVTPVKISFAGGEDVTGTAPADMYQLEGRKITLPANPFTKTGYKFDKWGTYAAGSDYTVGDSDVTFTAAWVIKTAVSITETAQNVTYNGKGQGFAFKGTHKDIGDFTVRYYVGSVWTTEAPTNAGTYDVKIERAEDDTYASYEKTVSGGFVIDKYVVPEADITLVTDNFTYNGKNQANALTASYKDVDGKAVALVLGTCNLSNVNGKKVANFTDAGDYTAVFLFTSPFESDNYALVYEEDGDYYEAYFTMKPKEVQIDWVSDNFTYNGNVQTVTASYKDVDGKTVSLTVGVTDFKNAGEYTAAASFANSETNYALPAVATKNYTMAKANAEVATVPTAKTLTYDGTRMTLVNEGVGIDGTMQYKLSGGTYGTALPTVTDAGTYVVFYKVVGDENHNDTAEATVTVTVEKLAIDEPTVLGTYKYTGEEQTVSLNGVLPGMRTTDSLTKTDAGIYEAHFTLDENHRWNDGSDGVVSWEIKPVKIAPQEESTDDKPQKQDVFVETEEGFPSDVTVIVEVTVESSVVEKISDNSMSVDYYNLQNEDIKLQNDEKVGVVFNVKLLRTTGNSTVEIQPEDIAPGTKIKVKMLIPTDVDVTKVTRILHVHTPDDIEEIPFDASRIDSEGYYEIEIDRLSEFAFIYERDFIHWIILAWLVALLIFVSVLWFALSIRRFCEEKKLHAAPVVGFVLHALGTAFLAFFALCVWCYVGLIANAAALIVFTLIYLGVFGKNNSEAKKEEIPDSTKAFAPVETAPVDTSEDELSLKDAMRAATVAHADVADSVNKKTVATFLTKTYGDTAEVNCRDNYIKSGILPLADTHYKKFENGKKCFIYVYELKDGKVFFLVRADEKTAEKIKSEHPAFMHSAYPKTKEHDWYTLLLDDSFRTSLEVFDTLAFVFEKFTRDNRAES